MQACEEQEASAAGQLHQLDASFKAAVADIMGLTPSPQLAAAIQRQQQLCEDEVRSWERVPILRRMSGCR